MASGTGYTVVEADGGGQTVRAACGKTFFVSPFMGMDMTYEFRLATPDRSVATTIRSNDAAGAPVLLATFAGQRKPLTDWRLFSAFVRFPLLTLKVILAIHWEALKLLSKGLALQRKPSPPTRPTRPTIALPSGSGEKRPSRTALSSAKELIASPLWAAIERAWRPRRTHICLAAVVPRQGKP